MTMSPRDRVLNNELVTNKVNKVKFNSIHDFLEMVLILKCGFCKNLLLYECNSDQLPTFFILSSLLGGFAVALLLHPPKSDDKMRKVGNWSELHS